MELNPADRLPFHDEDEAVHAHAGEAVPSRDAHRRHLQRVPLFSGFDEDELRRVEELSRIVEVPVGTVLTRIGDAGESFFVIIDGTAAVRTPVGAGGELRPGDFFGEMSLLDGGPRSATVVADTPVRLLVIGRKHFAALLEDVPGLTATLLTTLSRRVRQAEDQAQRDRASAPGR